MSKKNPEQAEHRLVDLEVREVSVVDRPANKRRWLIVKRNSTEDNEMARTAIPAFERDERGWRDDPADPIVKVEGDDALGDPPEETEIETDSDAVDLLGIAEDLEQDLDAGANDPPITEPEVGLEQIFKATKAGAAAKRVQGLVTALMRAVNQMKGLGEKPMTPAISNSLKTVVQALTMLSGKKATKVEKVQTAALQSATSALERLMSLANSLKAMDANEDVGSDDLAAMSSIASALGALIAGPAAGGKAGGKKEEDAKVKEPDPKAAAKKRDEDDPVIVFKAGAKMKKARLSAFRKAVDTLTSLLRELEDGGGDKDKTQKVLASFAPMLEQVTKATQSLASKLEESSSQLLEQVQALAKRMDELENVRPAGEGDADPPDPVEKKTSLWGPVLGVRRA